MGKTKNLDQLLKELNEMQMQFDNLKDQVVAKEKKPKKNEIKTKLASDKIDNDFFKTLTTAPKIKDNDTVLSEQTNKIEEKENTTDDLLFSLDIDQEEIIDKKQDSKDNKILIEETFNDDLKDANNDSESIELIEDNKEIIEDNTIDKNDLYTKKELIDTNFQNLQSKKSINEVTDKNDDKVTEKSFLSIKQKLDRIKKEIATRELEISNEEKKVIKLPKKEKNTDSLTKKVLAPKNSIKTEPKKVSPQTNKTKNIKPNTKLQKRDTVDVLTIIILVLLIVLIITAWALLK